jgi:hypothetical protein
MWTGAGITGLAAIIAEYGSKTVVAAMITVWVILAVAGLDTACSTTTAARAE